MRPLDSYNCTTGDLRGRSKKLQITTDPIRSWIPVTRLLIVTAIAITFVCMGLSANPAAASAPFATVSDSSDGGGVDPSEGSNDRWRRLIEAIRKAKKALDDAKEATIADPVPLEPETVVIVADNLQEAEDSIDDILDPDIYPSLAPPDIGTAQCSFIPPTLAIAAEYAAILAAEAEAEAEKRSGADEEFIGSHLKTIKYLLPWYRTLAGIEP